MKVKNLAIVSQEVSEVQKGIVKGNTTVLNYSYKKDQRPLFVNFSIANGIEEGEGNYIINPAITGTFPKDGNIRIETHSKMKRIGSLIDEIYDICDAIVNGAEEEKETKKK